MVSVESQPTEDPVQRHGGYFRLALQGGKIINVVKRYHNGFGPGEIYPRYRNMLPGKVNK